MVWVNWTSANEAYTVKSTITDFNLATMEADVQKMTTQGNAMYVDVLVCPYGSSNVLNCVQAVNKGYTGPVLAWGGASDTIFSAEYCGALPNKNCIGFFTPGSQYFATGLTLLDTKITKKAKVGIIVNDNPFSQSVADGAEKLIEDAAGLKLAASKKISVAKTAITKDDKRKVASIMSEEPDIVLVAGHNKDVEPVIIEIGKAKIEYKERHIPKAVIATNGLTNLDNFGDDKAYANCIMMPTQWDDSTSTKDPVVGWTAEDFHSAMGGSATYQQAAAGAAGVALSNAMKAASNDESQLLEKLKVMDVDSFYGKLKWTDGIIEKPMYTVQLQDGKMKYVAPTGAKPIPLAAPVCWDGEEVSKAVMSHGLFGVFFAGWFFWNLM